MESENKTQKFKICWHCSFFANMDEKAKFCPECGNELISACPKCNGVIDNPYAKFCKFCGTAYPGREKQKFQKF